jgi:pyruvate carboxylase
LFNLISNHEYRGEIAVRILHAIHELPSTITHPIETFALYTHSDTTHCLLGRPHHAILLPSPASYMDISYLIRLAKEHQIDHIHPGYGFLSESAEFAHLMWTEAGVKVIGPGWEALGQLGDKVLAKELARRCDVPVLEALTVEPGATGGGNSNGNGKIDMIREFVNRIGYPVMIKAVVGGGGRGIRLVTGEAELQNALDRATNESPSNTVFVEKAAVGGFHHIEVQIVGDGRGGVRHLWERDCSIQRRFQKIVECAPALISDRGLMQTVINSAVSMASEVSLFSSKMHQTGLLSIS